MRIPVRSCEGCNKARKLYPSGYHVMGKGNWMVCAFVRAEMADIPSSKFLGVFPSRQSALRRARHENGALVWSGQGPYEMWLVVRVARDDNPPIS